MTCSLLALVFFCNLHMRDRHCSGGRELYYDTTSDAASHEPCLPGSTADVSTCSSTSYGTARASATRTATSIQSRSISGGGRCSLLG